MDVSIAEARERLAELLERVDAGEEVILTREGHGSIRLVREDLVRRPRFDRAVIDEIVRDALSHALPGPDAAHSQDFLYDEFGLPQ